MMDSQYSGSNRNDVAFQKYSSQNRKSHEQSKQPYSSRDSSILKTYKTNVSTERLHRTIPRNSSINKLFQRKHSRKVISMFNHPIFSKEFSKDNRRSYNTKNLFGRSVMNSKQENTPSFSFGTKQSKNAIISNKHTHELVGKDSPGVGAYQYDVMNLSAEITKRPKFAITKDRRFEEQHLRQKKFKDR